MWARTSQGCVLARGLRAMVLGMLVLAGALPPDAHAVISPNNEWGRPTAAAARSAPRGWMLVIHGGGWLIVGKDTVITDRPYAEFFAAHGWGTYSVDYRPGAASLADVLSAYDLLRARVGGRAPICAFGSSAGGHLAMMLAARRHTLRCVISEAGPTDLLTLPTQPAAGGSGPASLFAHYVVPAFGSSPDVLARWSPVFVSRSIRARMLLGASTADPMVPQFQMNEMQMTRPDLTRTMLLPGAAISPFNFTHASVTPAALQSWHSAELRLLDITASHR